MAYAMIGPYGRNRRSISAAAAVARGYCSVIPLSVEERKHLLLLVACRLCCSVTLGAFSYQQNPENEYLLLHAEPAWQALELLWDYDATERSSVTAILQRVFDEACNCALEAAEPPQALDVSDLAMPDPCIPDLLAALRATSAGSTLPSPVSKKSKLEVENQSGESSITFVTGNVNKLKEVKRILRMADGASVGEDDFPFGLRHEKIDLLELQGNDTMEIARAKCIEATQHTGGAVITEDTSLCFTALNDLPGPYIKWFLEKCGHDGLNRMLAGYEDKSAYAQTVVAFTPGPNVAPVLFEGITKGRIVPPRGSLEFGWDPIFEPDEGGGKTYAEMSKDEKDAISHRSRAFGKLREYFRQEKDSIHRQLQSNERR
jgi:inosine triphosphate pyrophosphatase